MNIYSFYTSLYGRLQNYGMPYWALSPFRRIVRKLANKQIPLFFETNKKEYKKDWIEKNLIVSFTSFPARINNVWKVVESLKRQTTLPEKIILWLSKDQFPDEQIPQSLLNQIDDLFEVHFVDGDIRSHKKYFYILQSYPEKTFITCDDDVFYDPKMIQRLIETSRRFPGCIIANHTSQIKFDIDGEILSYSQFGHNIKPLDSRNLMQIGIGGVLYPPFCLHELVMEKNVFMNYTPLADDIWLSAMSRLKGTPVVQSSLDILPLPIESDAPSLADVNNGENRNDLQIRNLKGYFNANDIFDIFSSKCDIKVK